MSWQDHQHDSVHRILECPLSLLKKRARSIGTPPDRFVLLERAAAGGSSKLSNVTRSSLLALGLNSARSFNLLMTAAVPAQVQGTATCAYKRRGEMGTWVRCVWVSTGSLELQTLAPRLPPFTDTPHPTSLIWGVS